MNPYVVKRIPWFAITSEEAEVWTVEGPCLSHGVVMRIFGTATPTKQQCVDLADIAGPIFCAGRDHNQRKVLEALGVSVWGRDLSYGRDR